MSVQVLLKQIRHQGIKLTIAGKNKIKYRSPKPIPPALLEKLKANKGRIIEALKTQAEPDQYPSKGQGQINNPEPSEGPVYENSRWCTGYQRPRWVHPDVCAWHVQEADIHCMSCAHLSTHEIETWMDSYLDLAIARLNAFYKKGDRISWSKRKMVDQLESQITQAFLAHDMQKVKELVDEWEKLFKEMRIPQCGM